jgi:hypothetical protein
MRSLQPLLGWQEAYRSNGSKVVIERRNATPSSGAIVPIIALWISNRIRMKTLDLESTPGVTLTFEVKL